VCYQDRVSHPAIRSLCRENAISAAEYGVRTSAWKYCDWVIRSLNADLGCGQFVKRQLAEDLLPDRDHAIASYFCLAGPDMPDVNSQDENVATNCSMTWPTRSVRCC